MKWNDFEDIASALELRYPDKDNVNIRFTDLREWILSLEGFEDHPNACNERILESIQAAWISEREDRE